MDLVSYVSSMVTWQGTALIPSQHSQTTEEEGISEEEGAEETMERDTKIRREIDSQILRLEYCLTEL